MWENPARSLLEILPLGASELGKVDPLVVNLLVAKGIPALAHLDISHYQAVRDEWAEGVEIFARTHENHFQANPAKYHDDIGFFRICAIFEYLSKLGIRYHEDQKDMKAVRYDDPSDLFLNGVMDERRGTCGNMAALIFVMSWRLGWPLGLASAWSHFVCRYESPHVVTNFEASYLGMGGVHTKPDEIWHEEGLSRTAVRCGSDLRSVNPHEMLGLFVGLRGRHFADTGRRELAEPDYLLARFLFPNNRCLYGYQMTNSLQYSLNLFDPHEKGHPIDLMLHLNRTIPQMAWPTHTPFREEGCNHAVNQEFENRYAINPKGVSQGERSAIDLFFVDF